MKAPRDKLLSEALASFELENEDPLNLLCLQGDLHPMRGCTGPSLDTLKVNLSLENSDLTALFKERHRQVVSACRDDSNRHMLLDNALSYLQEDAATRWSYWLRQSGRADATKDDLPHWSCCDNPQGDKIVGTSPEPLVLSNYSDAQEPAEFAPDTSSGEVTEEAVVHISLKDYCQVNLSYVPELCGEEHKQKPADVKQWSCLGCPEETHRYLRPLISHGAECEKISGTSRAKTTDIATKLCLFGCGYSTKYNGDLKRHENAPHSICKGCCQIEKTKEMHKTASSEPIEPVEYFLGPRRNFQKPSNDAIIDEAFSNMSACLADSLLNLDDTALLTLVRRSVEGRRNQDPALASSQSSCDADKGEASRDRVPFQDDAGDLSHEVATLTTPTTQDTLLVSSPTADRPIDHRICEQTEDSTIIHVKSAETHACSHSPAQHSPDICTPADSDGEAPPDSRLTPANTCQDAAHALAMHGPGHPNRPASSSETIVSDHTCTSNHHIPLSEHERLQQHLRMIDALLADSDLSPNQESEAILSNGGDVRRHSEPAAPALIISTPGEETSGPSTPSGPSLETTWTCKRRMQKQSIGENKRAKMTRDTVHELMCERTNHYGSTDSRSLNHSHLQSSPTNLCLDHQKNENHSNAVDPHFSGDVYDELGCPYHVDQVEETNTVRAGVDNFMCFDIVHSTHNDKVSSVELDPGRGSSVWSVLDFSGGIDDNSHAFSDPCSRTAVSREDRPFEGHEIQWCISVTSSASHLDGLLSTHQQIEHGVGKHLLELEVANSDEKPQQCGDEELDAQSMTESNATKPPDLTSIDRVGGGMPGSNHRTRVSTPESWMPEQRQPYAVNTLTGSRRSSKGKRKTIGRPTWINCDRSERASPLDDTAFWAMCQESYAWVRRLPPQLEEQRIVPDTAEVFMLALNGNMKGLQNLFIQGLASPRDVSNTRRENLVRWTLRGDLKQHECARWLLQQGASVERELSRDDDWFEEQKFPLVHKIVLRLGEGIGKSLHTELDRWPDAVFDTDGLGRTALDWATARAQLDDMRLLLDRGSARNTADKEGRTTLQHAIDSHNCEAVRMLLLCGASPNPSIPKDKHRSSPLASASFGGLVEQVKLLLSYGASIDNCNPEGRTPLHQAALNDNVECAALLLEHGADPLFQLGGTPGIDCTPFMTAIMRNSHGVLELFVGYYSGFRGRKRLGLLSTIARYADTETLMVFLPLAPLSGEIGFKECYETLRNRADYDEQLDLHFHRLVAPVIELTADQIMDDE
ncbi:hypothetical protein FSARC_1862 [Fusarium sarcochroum]|uniref:Ankyrin n=1 Tax=Fusarium sarcochroum TaxID=1208366 RepID=A0A8H4XEB8_9HYPO|nr:hypothetical protein FSARC_1862 [Fusarium sarcochroum]